jgi:hypothetical protein
LIVVRPTNCPSRTTYGVVGDAGGQVNAMNGIHRGGVVRPGVWQPPLECSALEWEVMKRIKRARLLCGLREHRHELFDEDFQAELAGRYQDKPVGSRRCRRPSLDWRQSCGPAPAPPTTRCSKPV